nr:MAG: hypothetical protein [Chemarfal virus 235]
MNDVSTPDSTESISISGRASPPIGVATHAAGGIRQSVRALSQARYWIATIPESSWSPTLTPGCQYLTGQLERGEGGYRHWQFVVSFTAKKTLAQVRRIFNGNGHFEPTRSRAAEEYVHKEDTRIGDPFQFGSKSINRNSKTDWESIRLRATLGQFAEIPADIFIRYYGNLKAIRSDSVQPSSMERSCTVYWGPTATGKSHRAWTEAGYDAYSKDPRTKFWCGYTDQSNIVIDEFRGAIDISHLLRWLDKYPVRVEVKGSSKPLMATKIWITSNLSPMEWYPLLDGPTQEALMRRLTVIKINTLVIS